MFSNVVVINSFFSVEIWPLRPAITEDRFLLKCNCSPAWEARGLVVLLSN